ncbi:MAG: GTPase ObgE [Saprospiraceae bacterium]|nr:GTPase ObgE [Saprospiraceae bacterium]
MAETSFIDYIKICCRSGAGGSGSAHFHRDRTNPKGGPDGGDGGRGGHIRLLGNRNLWTLLPLRFRKHVVAGSGQNGSSNQKTGANGSDVLLEVPLGTVARAVGDDNVRCEILSHGEEKILVEGGRGGLGNVHFKSSTNRAPRYAQPGEPGIEVWISLELKLLADVGLVGFPNAGKSTLLSTLSAAKPKIAAYPFTTLKPNLGIIPYRDHRSFVMADIPGIIQGAHEGKGLGHQFLRHIERNSILLLMIPCDIGDIAKDYQILLNELEQYNPELIDKPKFLVLTKRDLIDDELEELIRRDLEIDTNYLFISSVSQYGLTELKDSLWQMLTESD